MDLLDKTIHLLQTTELPMARVSVETNVSMTTIYAIMRRDSDPSYGKVQRIYEYLSGKRVKV